MVKNIKIALCFCFITLSAMAQEKAYMPLFEVINMHPDYQYSSTRLLKTYVDGAGKYILIIPSKEEKNVETIETAQKKAASMKLKYFVIGSLNRVGERVIVNVSLFNTNDASVVWTDQLKAQNPEDLDQIFEKIGKNMGTKTKAKDDENIFSTTDSKDLNALEVKKSGDIATGFMVLLNNYAKYPAPGISVGAGYDLKDFILNLKSNLFGNSDIIFFSGSLECYLPFFKKRSTPFFGGGMGLSRTIVYGDVTKTDYFGNPYVAKDNSSAGGLMLTAGGGYIFNRNSSVSFRLSGNFVVGLYQDGLITESTKALMFKMEILFSK